MAEPPLGSMSTCPACRNFGGAKVEKVQLFLSTVTDKWLQNYEDIILRVQACGHQVEVIDLSRLSYPPQVIDLQKGFFKLNLFPVIRRTWDYKENKSNGNMDPSEELAAISSELLTKYGGELGPAWKLLIALEKRVLSRSVSSLFKTLDNFAGPKSLWIVPNGRLAHQRAVTSFAQKREIPTLLLEESFVSRERYMLRRYGAHDRLSIQEDVLRMRSRHLREHLVFAKDWYLDREKANSTSNLFSANFLPSTSANEFLTVDAKQAVIFTSSDDEFRSMGSKWSRLGWADQYESFAKVSQHLNEMGYRVIVRVHPNLISKSSWAVKLEYKGLLLLKVGRPKVLGPRSHINSYDLMKSSHLVVVSVSTAGLEAVFRGKKVISTANNYFDMLGDSLSFSAESKAHDITRFLKESAPNGDSAKHWVANQLLQDYELIGPRRILSPNSLFSRIRFIFRPTAQLYFVSLWAVSLTGFLTKKFYLWRIHNLTNN